MIVLVTLNSGQGLNLGPNFTLNVNTGTINPSNATLTELLSGIYATVDNSATSVTITSLGSCTNSLILNINSATTTTTTAAPTTTTTTAAPTTTTTTTTAAPTTTTTAAPTTTTTAAPTTSTTTTAAPTTTTLPPTTTTTTTLPPLVITNGGVTCSGTTGSFTASFSGGTSTYNFVAIADSQANAATCVAGGACGAGGFRVTLGGGATSHNFSGIANGNWYTAVRDSLPQTSVQNTAVTINCTTTTTTAAPTTTTAAPTTTTTTEPPPPPLDYFEYTATICDGGTSNIITSSSLSVGSYYYITGGTPTTCYFIDSFVGATATSPNISFGGFATDCSDTTNCTQL